LIKYKCNNCGQQFSSYEKYAEKKGKCHKCGSIIVVPDIPTKNQTENIAKNDNTAKSSMSQKNTIESPKSTSPDYSIGMPFKYYSKRKKIVVGLIWCVIVVVVLAIIIDHMRHMQKMREAMHEYRAYHKQGESAPSSEFKNSIPEMKVFLEKMNTVRVAIKAIERNWDLGISYNDYKVAILKLGIACDEISNIPECREAETLVRNAKYCLSIHESALGYWKMSIDYSKDKYTYETQRSERLDYALKESHEFYEYYDFLLEECKKRE